MVGPVGIYIRRKVEETPEFLQAVPARSPLREILAHSKAGLLLGAGIVAVGTSTTYFAIYVPTYAARELHLPSWTGYFVSIVLGLVSATLTPFGGRFADRFGYTRLSLPSAILMLFSFYPVFLFITRHPSLPTLLGGLFWVAFISVGYTSGMPVLMAEIFPPQTRVTGLSLSYNLGVVVFGGFAPAIFTWLTAVTHNNTAPAFYLMATAVVSIAAILFLQRRGDKPVQEV